MFLLRLLTGTDDRLMTPFILVVSLSHMELAKVNSQEIKTRWLPFISFARMDNSRLFGVYLQPNFR